MRRRLYLLLACVAAPCATAAGFLEWLWPKHDVQIIAVTDATPVGALRRTVSPASPVYYSAINVGYHDFGGIIAGEKIPPRDQVVKTIANVLAKQGYLPANDAQPPSLLLLWTWGTMNTDRMYMGGDDIEGRQVNRRQLLRFMGAYKLGMISKDKSGFQDELFTSGQLFRDADSEMLDDLATEDLYVAAISAYDYTAAQRKEKVLLWTTKISCPSRGLSLPETLPVMLALAGPHIGRETAKPVSIKATEHYKPEVKVGDPTLVEFIDSNHLPVVDAPADALKKSSTTAPKKKKK
ncbi:MAG: hypothetical protein Q7S40_19670 [Opitutaceae bacterium]|nr:hypothetical protein [Opitutaceae bacterium]